MITEPLKKLPGVYVFTNLINGKRYVGETTSIARRMRDYRYQKKSCRPFESALLKYGWEAFDIAITYYPESDKKFLVNLEHLLIKAYASHIDKGHGYNVCELGREQKGRTFSAETRARMSEAHKGNKANLGNKASDETRAKQSKAHKGRIVSNETRAKLAKAHKGKTHSPEARAKIAAAWVIRKQTAVYKEQLANLSEANRNRVISEDTRKKLSEARKGNKNPNFGKTPSDDTRARMSEAKMGKKRGPYKKEETE
jgi:group I intron endonuclease